jgi:guanylate kinase
MPRGDLFILSAPSGAGKTTLIHRMLGSGLLGADTLAFSVSHTTRAPRPGEVAGTAYHFVDPSTFQSMIAANRFLEWAEVHGHCYGTSYGEVLPRLEQGIDVVLDIDVQGAERVVGRHPEAYSIFIMPPSFEDLERRLRQRRLDDPAEISRRLAVSLAEIERYRQYQYVIINDDAERASQVLAAILLDKRHQRGRMHEKAEKVLEDFHRARGGIRLRDDPQRGRMGDQG